MIFWQSLYVLLFSCYKYACKAPTTYSRVSQVSNGFKILVFRCLLTDIGFCYRVQQFYYRSHNSVWVVSQESFKATICSLRLPVFHAKGTPLALQLITSSVTASREELFACGGSNITNVICSWGMDNWLHHVDFFGMTNIIWIVSLILFHISGRGNKFCVGTGICQVFSQSWEHDSHSFWAHYSDVIMGSMAPQITRLTIVYSAVYSGADQRKHQSSASLAFVRGIHRGQVNSPHKVARKMLPFDDVIMQFLFLLFIIQTEWCTHTSVD